MFAVICTNTYISSLGYRTFRLELEFFYSVDLYTKGVWDDPWTYWSPSPSRDTMTTHKEGLL